MPLTTIKLDRKFYLRPTLDVAYDLIGKYLVYKSGGNILSARLVEVEAYIGENDPACHAAVGRTERNDIMYGIGGFSYIYFIYGMYHCLNIVTEREGYPAAVLIRAVEPVKGAGVGLMKTRFKDRKNNLLTNGPGKLCKAFNLTRQHNGLDLLGERLYLEDRGFEPSEIETSERIGIKKGIDRKYRFFEKESPYISGRK